MRPPPGARKSRRTWYPRHEPARHPLRRSASGLGAGGRAGPAAVLGADRPGRAHAPGRDDPRVRRCPRSPSVGRCPTDGWPVLRRVTACRAPIDPSTCRTDGGRTSQATRAVRRSRAGLRRCAGCHAGNPSRCRVSGGPSPSLLLQERPGGQPGRRQGEPVGEHETGCPPHPGAGEAWDGPHGPRRAPTWLDCRRYSAADPGDRVLAAVVARAGTEALSRSPGPLPPCPPPAERGGTHHLAEGGDQP